MLPLSLKILNPLEKMGRDHAIYHERYSFKTCFHSQPIEAGLFINTSIRFSYNPSKESIGNHL